MTQHALGIADLAEAAGLSRRAIRFYVQRGLLPPPAGAGRGARYETRHLAVLRSIQELQQRGYALEEIRRILAGAQGAELPPAAAPPGAQAWLRATLGPGVELHFDPARAALGAADLRALADLVAERLGRRPAPPPTHPEPDDPGRPRGDDA
ncbi:MAG: MerR family transcriptional regulator [Planctomycetes bacterium]|nr:MerR family transcriptional regulator [Planctomycetota bacterium]